MTMEIGGYDISIKSGVTDIMFHFLFRAAETLWPDGVLEVEGCVEIIALRDLHGRIPKIPSSFYLYENAEAQEAWTRDGLTKKNANQIISVTVDNDGIDFVIDRPDGGLARFIRDDVTPFFMFERAHDR